MTAVQPRAPAPGPGLVAALAGALGADELRETHISWVLLTGDRAYKLKKPVRLPFLDYGTPERRREMCDEEIRLNRRLAPRVYLGVKAVVPTGDRVALAPADDPAAIDYVVEMRRFDETRTLAARVTHGGVPYPALVAVGRALADFHRATPARDGAHATTALTAALAENAETLAELAPDLDFARRAAGLARFMDAFMTARRAELQRRAADARVTAGQTFEGALADDVAPAQHVVLRTDRPEDALDDLAALLDARLGARRP